MNIKINGIIAGLLCFASVCCSKTETPPNRKDGTETETGVTYKVVAHRGGYLECGRPDCSLSSLKYAIQTGCYASECDILLTSDNEILVAHPVDGCYVNGLVPYESTLEEIRSAGTLANGERMPSLEDFLEVLKDPEQNPRQMKLWLDVKRLTKDGKNLDFNISVRACLRACEIIREAGAEELCEFLIPTGADIFNAVKDKVIDEYGINLAWMTCTDPARYGKAWAQLSYDKILGNAPASSYRPEDYIDAGIPLSIYNVDEEAEMDETVEFYPALKAIFTNYPKRLIEQLKENGYAD